jgi:DNA polymerase I-like protein with 3'-5' exonuclease and polymerase domains
VVLGLEDSVLLLGCLNVTVLAIHDEVVVEAPEEKADEVKEWLTTCMVEGMAVFLREVPVKVEIAVNDSWS